MNAANWPHYPDTPPPPPLPDEDAQEMTYNHESALAYQLLRSFGIGETVPSQQDARALEYTHYPRPTPDRSGIIHDTEITIPGTSEHVKVVALQDGQHPGVFYAITAFMWPKGSSASEAAANDDVFMSGPEGILTPLPAAEGHASMPLGHWQEHAHDLERRMVTALSSCNLQIRP